MNGLLIKQQRFIHLDHDLDIWVETFGKGSNETCLLISGAGANASFWSDSFCNRLYMDGFSVVKFDHRDMGYSSSIDFEKEPYELTDLAGDVIGIMDALELDRAHLIGHSMGGFIVQLLAITHPDRIHSITSISASTSSPEIPPPPEETWKIFMENTPRNDLDKDLPGFMKVWKYLNGTAEFHEELAVEYTRNLYARQSVEGPLGENHVKAQASLSDRSGALGSYRGPALVLHGLEDYLVDYHGGVQTAQAIKQAELSLIPGMGHMMFNTEILHRVEKEISKFLVSQHRTVGNDLLLNDLLPSD